MHSEELDGPGKEPLAFRGERDLAGGPLEQSHPQLRLEPGYVAAERLLRDEEPGRRPAEVKVLGHGDEVPQQPRAEILHGRMLP
jgi:hypothetical protein